MESVYESCAQAVVSLNHFSSFILVCVIIFLKFIYVYAHMCNVAHTRRSEDNLWE